MYDSVIKLISETKTVDKYGDTVVVQNERTVFCEVKSIMQTEFYQAQALGYKPEIKFVIADFLDYQGEMFLKYATYGRSEEEYTIIRTYQNGYELEIVCKRGIDNVGA